MRAFCLGSGKEVSLDDVAKLGVLYWKIDSENYEPQIQQICADRKYGHRSIVEISPTTLPNYDQMITKFFTEHIHDFEEIRFIIKGGGYFDVRDKDDTWIRLHVVEGDLIVLPAGIYHRFRTDETNYTKAMRLFLQEMDAPIWTPIDRTTEDIEQNSARRSYVQTFLSQ